MLLNFIQTGLTWYYFNVIAIAYIIYMLLKITYERARNATGNRAESVSKESKFYYRFIFAISIFGIVYFFTREHIEDMREIWESFAEFVERLTNE